VAARRLGQLGKEVVLVEREAVGGTCLNWGCIPTKALYSATSPLGRQEAFRTMGVDLTPHVDLPCLREWTREVVRTLRQGVEKLLAASGVELIKGEGRLSGPGRVRVTTEEGEEELQAQAVVLATGSAPIELPGLPVDGERVWSSRDALALPRIPEHLVVVGGGVIGLELATVYRRLGSQVTVVEMMDRLLPGVSLSRRGLAALGQALRRQGIEVRLNTAAVGCTKGGLLVKNQDGEEELPCEAMLVAVGRRPDPSGLGLETVEIKSERGFVATDEGFQAASGIYAIGDLRGGALLAHKASHEGLTLADRLAGPQPSPIKGEGRGAGEWVIPQAIFTQPEIGLVGLSEEEARKAGYDVVTGRFPMGGLGRALAEGESSGHFKIVADRKGKILGAEIVGPHASDLVAEAALAIQTRGTLEGLAGTIHAHPTFPEGLWEAVLSALDRPLSIV
jgi:dihydrolipoamide dehydrogenase